MEYWLHVRTLSGNSFEMDALTRSGAQYKTCPLLSTSFQSVVLFGTPMDDSPQTKGVYNRLATAVSDSTSAWRRLEFIIQTMNERAREVGMMEPDDPK